LIRHRLLRLVDVLDYLRRRMGRSYARPANSLVFREPKSQEGFPVLPVPARLGGVADYRQGLFELLTAWRSTSQQASAIIDDILGLAAQRQQANARPPPRPTPGDALT
jgi:hypothetical protein